MRLAELADQNGSLLFLDDRSGERFRLNEISERFLDVFSDSTSNRKLVFFYADNTIESVGLFWALMQSNHVVAMLPPTLSNPLKEELEHLYTPDFIADKTRDEIHPFRRIQDNPYCIFATDSPITKHVFHPSLKLLLNTSGTTGSPKFVKLSEENLIANARSIASYLPIKKTDVCPLNLPIYYSYGLSVLTSNALSGGKIVCSTTDVMNKVFWERFEAFGYSSLAGVPFTYEMLDRIGFTKKNYPSLRYFTQAGGRLNEALVSKFGTWSMAQSIPFFVMYGQTEATARMAYLPPDETLKRPGSIGKAIPGGTFTLDKSSGELLYSGANIFGGYVENPADFAQFEPPTWLKTGDLARMDDEGFVYLIGREKRFMKLQGNRVNLDEIESRLSAESGKTIRCAGIDDKTLVVFFLPSDQPEQDLNQLASRLFGVHPAFVRTFGVESWPTTANGKIDYKQLSGLYGTR